MNIINYILNKLGLRKRGKKIARFDASIMYDVQQLSLQQNRPLDQVTNDILALGLQQHQIREVISQTWEALTPRRKDVAALMCLGFTNQEIAERLNISAETVKVHIRGVFEKFNVQSRKQLAEVLKEWDFSAWLDLYGKHS